MYINKYTFHSRFEILYSLEIVAQAKNTFGK
jgi:hypothetical protein